MPHKSYKLELNNHGSVMNLQEKFHLFDIYIEGIDGLSSTIKKPLSTIARCVFEAETGINVNEEPIDVAEYTGLNDLVSRIDNAASSNQDIAEDFQAQVNSVIYQIDSLAKEPDVEKLSNVDTTSAHEAVNQFHDTKQQIEEIDHELNTLKGQFGGWNQGFKNGELLRLKTQVAELNQRKQFLMAIGKPYERIEAHLQSLDKAILNAQNSKRSLAYRQKEFDSYVSNKTTADAQRQAILAAKQAYAEEQKKKKKEEGTAAITSGTKIVKPTFDRIATETPLSDEEIAMRNLKTKLTETAASNGTISIFDCLPSLEPLLDIAARMSGNVSEANEEVNTLQTQLISEVNTLRSTINQYLGDADFQDTLQHLETQSLYEELQQKGIDVGQIDGMQDELDECQNELDSIKEKLAAKLSQLNAMKRAAHTNEFATGVNTDEFSTENADLLSAIDSLRHDERYSATAVRNMQQLVSVFGTIKTVLSQCGWIDNVILNRIGKLIAQRNAAPAAISEPAATAEAPIGTVDQAIDTTPDEINDDAPTVAPTVSRAEAEDRLVDTKDVFETLVQTAKSKADSIRDMYKAIVSQNKDAKLGVRSSLKVKMRSFLDSIIPEDFTTDTRTKNFLCRLDGVNVPIRVAYEMAVGSMYVSATKQNLVMQEYAPVKGGTEFVQHWKLNISLDNAATSTFSILAKYDSKSASTTVHLANTSVNDVLQAAMNLLLTVLPDVKEQKA